ncbi:MAG: leucyl aminopeptidase, partial [Janthinobacterium lividum]
MLIKYAATVTAEFAGALAVVATKDAALSGAALALDGLTGGQVARAIAAARFDGDAASIVEIFAPANSPATRVLVVGLGKAGAADASAFEKIGGAIVARLITSGEKSVTIDLTGVDGLGLPLAEAAARLAHGATLRAYRFDKYHTTMKAAQKPTLEALTIVGADDSAHADLAAIAAGVALTRDLVSEPANIIYPESFVERAAGVAPAGLAIEVLGEAEMTRLGMGALLGVSQGSDREAKILVMRWNGGGNAVPVVLVGKGVTFDTGGISLKPPPGMEDMKWDMGGAGAVTGALHALAARGAKVNVIGVCGLVENMPDGKAQRPGDVVTSMSGQTIEVINTDAEGRLVLCDVLWWAQEQFKPEVIVDLATLTGAMIISLGHEHG